MLIEKKFRLLIRAEKPPGNFKKNVAHQAENIFQLNCGKLDKSSDFISTNLSSSSIGILANINYNELVIDQPYDLVPNYVSPFIVNKNK